MSLAAAPVRPMTIEDWYSLFHDVEGGRSELVRGHAIMTPTERLPNIAYAQRLAYHLVTALGGQWQPLPGASVIIAGDPAPTIRVPDLIVVPATALHPGWQLHPADAALVVEVVSPSSVERDFVTEREEYAAAGIPNYLLIDARCPDGPRLWLFDRLVRADGSGEPTPYDEPSGPTTYDEASGRTTYPRYADPTGDGLSVTLRIPGADPITITATDLA